MFEAKLDRQDELNFVHFLLGVNKQQSLQDSLKVGGQTVSGT